MTTKHNDLVVIIADDDEDDLYLIKMVLESSPRNFSVHIVSDGKELLDYLNQLSETDDGIYRKKPGLIFLDINMPRMNGLDALKDIRKHPHFACTPVVMLTTAKDRHTIDTCYANGAVGYLTKPDQYSVLQKKINTILAYWFETITHPLLG